MLAAFAPLNSQTGGTLHAFAVLPSANDESYFFFYFENVSRRKKYSVFNERNFLDFFLSSFFLNTKRRAHATLKHLDSHRRLRRRCWRKRGKKKFEFHVDCMRGIWRVLFSSG